MTDAQEPSSLPVLDAVTDYEKIERIGEGTFGIVCACTAMHMRFICHLCHRQSSALQHWRNCCIEKGTIGQGTRWYA